MSPLFEKKRTTTNEKIAEIIERFLEGRGGPWAWDDFTLGGSFSDPDHEKVRLLCASLSQEFPPSERGHYCGAEGFAILRRMVAVLRRTAPPATESSGG